MKEQNPIPSYVVSVLSGNASVEETEEFNEWLKNPDNEKVFYQMKKVNQISSDLRLYHSFDKIKGLSQVKAAIRLKKRRLFISKLERVAAVLFIPLLIGALIIGGRYIMLRTEFKRGAIVQQISSPPGTRTHFFLPDSSEVWLNASSTIKFPTSFNGKTREIELDGEGFFKVYKNKKKPFIVRNDRISVKALGTAFNFCSYTDDSGTFVTLEEGKIEVRNPELKRSIIVNPGEQIHLAKSNGEFFKKLVNVNDFTAWRDGNLVFNKTPLIQVVNTLDRWYNVQIKLVDKDVANYRYTATFTNESIYQVLELLKLTAPIDYSITARTNKGNGTQFTKQEIKIWKTTKPNWPM